MHAVFLAGLLQLGFGNVDLVLVLVACVLLGSILDGLHGAYLTRYLPSYRLQQMLCTILGVVGARML